MDWTYEDGVRSIRALLAGTLTVVDFWKSLPKDYDGSKLMRVAKRLGVTYPQWQRMLSMLEGARAEKIAQLGALQTELDGLYESMRNATAEEEAATDGVIRSDTSVAVRSARPVDYEAYAPTSHQDRLDSTRWLAGYLEREAPDLWARLYPRVYAETGAYHTARGLSVAFGESLLTVRKLGLEQSPVAHRVALPCIQFMMERRMPLMFIAPKFLEALKLTDFKEDIDWVNLKLPYEHGVFVLPRGGYSHHLDGEVAYIIWSRWQGGDAIEYPSPYSGIPRIRIANHKLGFSLIAVCPAGGGWYDSSMTIETKPTVRMHNLFSASDFTPESKKIRLASKYDELLDEQDKEFLEGIGVIFFGAILALNTRANLLTPEKLESVVPARKDKLRREFWTPNIIGRDYAPRQVVSAHVGTGTHASPRMHWRRGHFRGQAYGPGRSEHKTVWIEPTLVSAEV